MTRLTSNGWRISLLGCAAAALLLAQPGSAQQTLRGGRIFPRLNNPHLKAIGKATPYVPSRINVPTENDSLTDTQVTELGQITPSGKFIPNPALRNNPELAGIMKGAARPITPPRENPEDPNSRRPNTLYSTFGFAPSDGLNPANDLSTLWAFPSVGYSSDLDLDEGEPNFFFGQLSTDEVEAATVNPPINTGAPIIYGRVGYPFALSRQIILIRTVDVTTGTFASAGCRIQTQMYDGVEPGDPPSPAKLATRNLDNGTRNFGRFDFASTNNNITVILLTSGNGLTSGTGANPFFVRDSQGRFGYKIAKFANFGSNTLHTQPTIQLQVWYGAPIGPNANFFLDASTGTVQLFGNNTDPNGNQSYITRDGGGNITDANTAYNFFLWMAGDRLTSNGSGQGTAGYTPPTITSQPTGYLEGNIRSRAVDIPAAGVAESKPRFYRLLSFLTGTNTLVREDFFFTQPSYDSSGTLVNNFRLEGYPVGNYDIVLQQAPLIVQFPATPADPFVYDTVNSVDKWPFHDFYPAAATNFPVVQGYPAEPDAWWYQFDPQPAEGSPTDVNARLERYGDIAGSGDPNNPTDGIVDLFDLVALFDAYGSNSNPPTGPADPEYNPLADLTGSDPDQLGDPNPSAFPDGIVDLLDLVVLFTNYGLGDVEVP